MLGWKDPRLSKGEIAWDFVNQSTGSKQRRSGSVGRMDFKASFSETRRGAGWVKGLNGSRRPNWKRASGCFTSGTQQAYGREDFENAASLRLRPQLKGFLSLTA